MRPDREQRAVPDGQWATSPSVYSREDHLAAERLAEALKSNGWSVWWDPDISPGEIWDELIERELANVSCVVVLWSATSIQKQWVKAEATEAQARGILVPVFIENVKPPLAFRQIQAAPLADWRGEARHAGVQQLLCTICELVGSRPQQPCQPDRKPPGGLLATLKKPDAERRPAATAVRSDSRLGRKGSSPIAADGSGGAQRDAAARSAESDWRRHGSAPARRRHRLRPQ